MRFKELKRILRTSPLRNSGLYHYFRYLTKKKTCPVVIDAFLGKDISEDTRRKVMTGMRKAMCRYHWDFDEYFMYGFDKMSHEERMEFVPEYEKNIFCARVNDPVRSRIFDSKWQTYNCFKEFFKRDMILLSSADDLASETFASFVEKHLKFIVKPDSEASGRGIMVFDTKDAKDAARAIVAKYGEGFRNLVVEELIIQAECIGAFHPKSVNTLRLRTFRFDDRVELLPCNMRIGQGGAFVDNTGQGGISAVLDADGRIIADLNEFGRHFETHPDTGLQIIGFQVPRWEEATALVCKLAMVVPEVRYVGWDLALTQDGWVMIEGNDKSMFVGIQMPVHKGFRYKVSSILDELKMHL